MGDIAIRVFAGLCGAALFAVINHFLLTLSGPVWFGALAAVFLVAFGLAVLVQRRLAETAKPAVTQKRGVGNVSGGAMKIKVEGAPLAGATSSEDGVRNKSQGDMDISIKDKK